MNTSVLSKVCLVGHYSHISSVQFSPSVVSNSSWPLGLQHARSPVLHYLPEFAQIHVLWVSDAIQPSHPLSSPSPPALNLSQHQGFFSNELSLHIRWPKNWSFSFSISPSNEYSGLVSFRTDWLDLLAVQRTQASSPTPQLESINSSALSLLYSPTLTSMHDSWKSHSFD